MKFRIVATSKDILIFIFFAIFLLYIVALGVLNLPQLASQGTFYGLNPLKAFSEDYLVFTLVFYLLALGGLFFSVSSYFFEWESGFGIGFNSKNSNGYSNWSSVKSIKNDNNIKRVLASDSTSEYAGIPLISNGHELWVDNGEYHNLVIGATGSGKTVNTILPSVKILAKKGESIICTDPKGEIYEKTGDLLKKKGYNLIVLNLRNPQNGNAWNPLSLPYKLYKNGNQDKAIELLDDLALNILYEENSANSDPFWEKTAADYFAGIALAMFEDTEEDKININSINMTATVGEDKFGGSTYIKEYFNYKDPSSAAYVNASGTVMAPSETKGGIISVFKQKVKLFASRENLSEMLSYSDFELESIGKVPTAVFIIIQDEKKTYHSLATILIKQIYETLIDVAQVSGGKLPVRTNFLLDEFANMPPLKDVTTMITAARSRQIRFTMIIQNFAQLNKVYGKDDAETIKGNCGNIIYLISTELAALEEISKLCGEKKSKKDDKTASTPLVTISDLQRMKQFDQIILRLRKNPFKTSFVPDFKINWGNCVSGKIDYPVREKLPVKIFDIRDFVKEKKNQKIKEMMSNMSGNDATSSTNFSRDKAGLGSKFDENELMKKVQQALINFEKKEKVDNNVAKNSNSNNLSNNHISETTNVVKKPIYDNKVNETTSKFKHDNIELLDDNDTVYKPKNDLNLSSINIERKVNEKLKNKEFDDINKINANENLTSSNINTMKNDHISVIKNVDKTNPVNVSKDEIKSDDVKEKASNKLATSLKLEDLSDDDKFFDDFFDD